MSPSPPSRQASPRKAPKRKDRSPTRSQKLAKRSKNDPEPSPPSTPKTQHTTNPVSNQLAVAGTSGEPSVSVKVIGSIRISTMDLVCYLSSEQASDADVINSYDSF